MSAKTRDATSSVSTDREIITPEMAEKLLEKAGGNRKVNNHIVQRYADLMTSGNWHFNGDSIRVDAKGKLLDGQHRLSAVVRTGIPLDTIVVRGVPRGVFDTIDVGRPRSAADALFAEGVTEHPQIAASVANLLIRTEENSVHLHKQVEPYKVHKWVLKHPDLNESVEYARYAKALGKVPILGAMHYMFKQIDQDKASEFFQTLKTGADIGPGNPIYTLREFLVRHIKDQRYDKLSFMALFVKAWNAFIQERQLFNIRLEKVNSLPKVIVPGQVTKAAA
jgi:hypothetical protein